MMYRHVMNPTSHAHAYINAYMRANIIIVYSARRVFMCLYHDIAHLSSSQRIWPSQCVSDRRKLWWRSSIETV